MNSKTMPKDNSSLSPDMQQPGYQQAQASAHLDKWRTNVLVRNTDNTTGKDINELKKVLAELAERLSRPLAADPTIVAAKAQEGAYSYRAAREIGNRMPSNATATQGVGSANIEHDIGHVSRDISDVSDHFRGLINNLDAISSSRAANHIVNTAHRNQHENTQTLSLIQKISSDLGKYHYAILEAHGALCSRVENLSNDLNEVKHIPSRLDSLIDHSIKTSQNCDRIPIIEDTLINIRHDVHDTKEAFNTLSDLSLSVSEVRKLLLDLELAGSTHHQDLHNSIHEVLIEMIEAINCRPSSIDMESLSREVRALALLMRKMPLSYENQLNNSNEPPHGSLPLDSRDSSEHHYTRTAYASASKAKAASSPAPFKSSIQETLNTPKNRSNFETNSSTSRMDLIAAARRAARASQIAHEEAVNSAKAHKKNNVYWISYCFDNIMQSMRRLFTYNWSLVVGIAIILTIVVLASIFTLNSKQKENSIVYNDTKTLNTVTPIEQSMTPQDGPLISIINPKNSQTTPISLNNSHAPHGLTILINRANNGDALASFELGLRYSGLSTQSSQLPIDHKEAVAWYRRAAEAGHPPAQYRLASALETGIGSHKDENEARTWYLLAAESGHARAMHNMGVFEANSKNPIAAIKWFRKAAAHGIVDSQFNLGIIYSIGSIAKRDLIEAYYWFSIAADSGDKEASKKRDEIAQQLNKKATDKAKAMLKSWKPELPDPKANNETTELPDDAQ